ncbi:MAG: NAD(P)-dependent oxidoreductase [Acidobacteria bacterium SCN 69-37]|nr:MAG: NAD(P)-dependent oxidoreductase [Acidobacteria bacterium SCN 69-37]
MKGKVLVLGATGHIGQPLVASLLATGATVKAASRAGLPVEGAESVAVDITVPSTVEAALEGVDRAFVMLPGGHVRITDLLLPIIAAAAARRIKVVLLSVLGVDAADSIPYRQVELALERSGTPFVILRPNWFADNFHTYWRAGIALGQIALPAGDGRTSFIDVRDIAACAAAVLTTDAFDGQAFNLTGPEALGYADAAELISDAIGRPVTYTSVDDDTFIGTLTGAGVPDEYARFLTSIFEPVRLGATAVVTSDVATLTGTAPRSLDAYVRDHAIILGA